MLRRQFRGRKVKEQQKKSAADKLAGVRDKISSADTAGGKKLRDLRFPLIEQFLQYVHQSAIRELSLLHSLPDRTVQAFGGAVRKKLITVSAVCDDAVGGDLPGIQRILERIGAIAAADRDELRITREYRFAGVYFSKLKSAPDIASLGSHGRLFAEIREGQADVFAAAYMCSPEVILIMDKSG